MSLSDALDLTISLYFMLAHNFAQRVFNRIRANCVFSESPKFKSQLIYRLGEVMLLSRSCGVLNGRTSQDLKEFGLEAKELG